MNNPLDLFSPPTAKWFASTFGTPTPVQAEAWPAIQEGKPVLVSAPTGTGKTLSAFLTFIDRLKSLARAGELAEQIYVIYVSLLKSLAGDIRENLRRPLDGIKEEESAMDGEATEIKVAIRTGDTLQRDRQRMIKHPPHILIITPESLYLMLTGKASRTLLSTAQAIILDELHALIDTKRGAHLMLSIARLDYLCGHPVQRIGLSATIEPLALAADYLSPEKATIIAPKMEKKVQIEVLGTLPRMGRRKDPVWEELAAEVYKQCQGSKSVIAFSEGRRYAEKIAYYVNQLGGEGFARVHHGSLSKEWRMETEQALRDGSLRLLCATSSMELGIDVGDIDQVLQIGCPRTVSGTMQRLGRAGHGPGRISLMYMYPRTAPEGLFCGMTAEIARRGGVEQAAPPRLCLDVLAQHLVSMATAEYTVDDVMEIVARAYPFRDVTRADVRAVLEMLAGDYEHDREIPVRPRVLYDRLHGKVSGDAYSRMLAVAAGGTIPDKGLYLAKTEDGVTLGELDEEFVYETRIGDKIVLGSFAWRVQRQDRDTVIVAPTTTDGARLPFWKGEIKGRSLKTSLEFGKMSRQFARSIEAGTIREDLARLGMNESAAESAADFLKRQIDATGILPDDRTVIVEHFTDHTGCHQIMVHALYGKRVNAPLAMLMQHAAMKVLRVNVGCVEDEDGFLLYPYGEEILPEGLIYAIPPQGARKILEAMLPLTPVFSMTFRYNAARALMMGMKNQGRQPLWLQRLKSTEMLDALLTPGKRGQNFGEGETAESKNGMESGQETGIKNKSEIGVENYLKASYSETNDFGLDFTGKNHPLIRETRRECLEDLWDIEGVLMILQGIQSGTIAVREVYTEVPSPMSLPLQWQVEAAEMYSYTPSTDGLRQSVYAELEAVGQMKPAAEELRRRQERKKLPENAEQLHSLLMIEGDLLAEELVELCGQERLGEEAMAWPAFSQEDGNPVNQSEKGSAKTWLQELIDRELVAYIEPGLWIAAEQREEYEKALVQSDREALTHIVRRMLYYRGAMTAGQIGERYFLPEALVGDIIGDLLAASGIVADDGIYYHAKHYSRARKATVRNLRAQTVTRQGEAYAAMLAALTEKNTSSEEQLSLAIRQYSGQAYPAAWWETVILPRRVKGYRENMLDLFLAKGEYFWRFNEVGDLCFAQYEEIDWEQDIREPGVDFSQDEKLLYQELGKRGASFMRAFQNLPLEGSVQDGLLSLAKKGYVSADSFLPVRQWINRDKIKKASPRARVNARVMALQTGRWDVVRPLKTKPMEEWLEQLFRQQIILCRETYRRPESFGGAEDLTADAKASDMSWGRALEILRIWEYTGKVRRGYYVAGMSGAQFVRSQDYDGVVLALKRYAESGIRKDGTQEQEIIWLNAVDPAQIWGKALADKEGRAFMNIPGTLVALSGGKPIAVLERQGKTLRFLEKETAVTDKETAVIIKELVSLYKQKKVFPDKKRLVIKEYPPEMVNGLREAGFQKEMLDYVLYL